MPRNPTISTDLLHDDVARSYAGKAGYQRKINEIRHGSHSAQGFLNYPVTTMLHWTLVFLVIAIVAAILGFGSLAGTAATIAKVLFLIFLVLWIVSFIMKGRA